MMSNMRAKVAHPNTPETDAMPLVEHIVEYTRGGIHHSVTVLASDPMDAINIVKQGRS